MSPKTQNPVLAGTGSEICSRGLLNNSDNTLPRLNVHKLRADRVRMRFGIPARRAALIATLAWGGAHG